MLLQRGFGPVVQVWASMGNFKELSDLRTSCLGLGAQGILGLSAWEITGAPISFVGRVHCSFSVGRLS